MGPSCLKYFSKGDRFVKGGRDDFSLDGPYYNG